MRDCYSIPIGLARTRSRTPKCRRKTLIKALLLPHIRYCLSVWGGFGAGERHRDQKAIHFGARIVTGFGRRDHVTPVELGWPTPEDMIASCNDDALRHLIDSPCSRTAAAGQLHLPRMRTELLRRSFLFRAARTWNTILR